MRDHESKRRVLHDLIVRLTNINKHLALLFLCIFYAFKLTLVFLIIALMGSYFRNYYILNVIQGTSLFFFVLVFVRYLQYLFLYRKDLSQDITDVDAFSKKMLGNFRKLL